MLNAQFIMLVSIFCFSLAGYFSSLLALHLLALSMLIRFLIPTTFSFVKIRNFNFLKVNTSSTIILCAIRGLVIFFSQYLLYLAIHSLGLASGLILYNLGPIILIIIFSVLGNKLKNISGVSGAAILGDGRVGLILDASSLIELAMRS